MKFLRGPGKLRSIGAVLLAWSVGLTVKAEYPLTILSQGPVGYWRLNETTQPPPPRPAANSGSLAAVANGQYIFGDRVLDAILRPQRGEPGALVSPQLF